MKKSLGIYVHVPFCLKKCLYCDFCSLRADDGLKRRYTEELCRRAEAYSPMCKDYTVDTVYFGGGTPTLLPIDLFRTVIDTLFSGFDVSENAEMTAECNPATADYSYLCELRKMGINRLSIGLQSIHENELKLLGRAHGYNDFLKVYSDARRAGFDNISVDLMYGIPEQSVESFRVSLAELTRLRPEHISAYGLKIEEATPFYKIRDKLVLPDEDEELEMYLSLSEMLERSGYGKYEISNFSLKGRESKHNLRYWRGEEYLGIGVAAHSCFQGVRSGNSRDIDAFIRGEDITEECYALGERDKINELVMLSLRLSDGLPLDKYKAVTGESILDRYPNIGRYIDYGYMKLEGECLSFTDRGFFVSNSILAELIESD